MKLIIANTDIHQDTEGRFSLNDLHRASGGEDRHLPAQFLRLQQTQELIAAIDRSTDSQIGSDVGIPTSVSTKKGGAHQGTYGVKEVVYAYANWISADFYLRMIRTFDAVATGKAGAGTAAALPWTKRDIDAARAFITGAAKDLKLAQSSVLGMYQKLGEKAGLGDLLPAYTVDVPTSSGTGSGEPTLPLGAMLERFGVGMSAIAFNRLLMQAGFLEEIERPSSKGGTKKYKSITDLEYGKNLNSAENPRETQPHWYISKFPELLELVMPKKPVPISGDLGHAG